MNIVIDEQAYKHILDNGGNLIVKHIVTQCG